MAERMVFGIAANLLTKVASTAFDEIGLLYGIKDELKKLENTLTTINAVLADAEEKQEKSHAIRIWIKRLEQVVCDADDLLDKFAYQDLRRKQLDKRMARKVNDFFSSSNNQLVFRLKMGHTIKEIRGRLDEIANDISKFNFLSKTVTVNTRFFGNRERETVSYVSTSELIIGRDGEKEEIIKKLIGPDTNTSDGVPPVIVIVGIGGLGKTSLAKLVFNDKRVAEHFEPRIWVCVSEDFDRKLIVKNILKSITDESVEKLDLEPLHKLLRKNLDGKKYLLVLDDVWNEEKERWIQLEHLLMVGANGSQIIGTTRSSNVATAMRLHSPVFLNGLTNEKSWQLFEKLAFREGLEKVNPKIIEIGKDLIKRCKGVPLAIRTLGSTMGSKTSESEWLSIQNSEIWSLSSNEGGILSVLKLSYDQLPTHIKYCFAYCSIFPKDYKFEYEALIQLWMAQSYVQTSSDKCQTLEYIGGQYVKDLLSISFFQEVEVDDSGNITNFKMHDLIHDLAIGVARSNCYCLTKSSMKNGNYDESIRHISLECQLMEELPRRVLKAKGMRTLFCLDGYDWEMGLSCQHTIMSNLTCLRVLDLNSCGIRKLASSIGTLKHLRYLDLSNNRVLEVLPNSISNLLNLQTLNLNDCWSIKHLPKDITKLINLGYLMIEKCQKLTHLPSGLGKLTNLRYLMLDGCSELTHMPPGLGKLTMMQKLPLYVVGNEKTVGHSCYGRLGELKGLNDLRGEIRIKHLEKVGADGAAAEAILKEKQLLQSLKLEWGYIPGSAADNAKEEEHTTSAELVLEGLEPHPNLKELNIDGYFGVRFPSWMIKMGNVVNITLRECNRCQQLQPLDQLPRLKFLTLNYLSSLEYIQEEQDYDNKNKQHVRDGHPPPPPPPPPPSSSSASTLLLLFFPSLQELDLRGLPKLKGWWKRRRESVSEEEKYTSSSSSSSSSSLVFPQLTKLTIQDCPMFTSMPLHPNIKELELYHASEKLVRERLTTTSAAEEEERKVENSISQLKSLYIGNIQELEVLLPEFLRNNLTQLQQLRFTYCPKLASLPQEIRCLTSLQRLEIYKCPNFSSLPQEIRCLTSLQRLEIYKCPNFSSLPQEIRCLTSLQQLHIYNCPILASLPQEIRCLTSLQQLEINMCPKLSERCHNETGEVWLNIAHIPNITIDTHKIQGTKFYL